MFTPTTETHIINVMLGYEKFSVRIQQNEDKLQSTGIQQEPTKLMKLVILLVIWFFLKSKKTKTYEHDQEKLKKERILPSLPAPCI